MNDEKTTEARLVGRIDENGKQMIGNMLGKPDDLAQALLDAEQKKTERDVAEADTDEDRIEALTRLVHDKVLDEREQVVGVLIAYATDCADRAEDLETSGNRERKRLRKTGHVTEAEDIKSMQDARASAFKVRAAIAADLAHKIENGWGRNPDGTVMSKVDADDGDLVAAMAKLKGA